MALLLYKAVVISLHQSHNNSGLSHRHGDGGSSVTGKTDERGEEEELIHGDEERETFFWVLRLSLSLLKQRIQLISSHLEFTR